MPSRKTNKIATAPSSAKRSSVADDGLWTPQACSSPAQAPVDSSKSPSSDARAADARGLFPDQRRGLQQSRSCGATQGYPRRSEEHTSELQSRENLVCRLLLEIKQNTPRQEKT